MRWWLALLVSVYLASAWPTRLTMVDDAYVALRYAYQLAHGNGLTFNAGQPPVEGYTDFAWVVLMAPGTLLPIHPSTWATTWGLLFGAVSVVAMAGLSSRFVEGRWALLPAAVLAASPELAVASTNGLET